MYVRFGEYTFDAEARQLRRAEEVIWLTPKLHDLLTTLIVERPRAVSSRELMDRLWPDVAVVEANVRNLIGELRQLLHDDDREPRFIRTIHRIGYAFIADVSAEADRRPRSVAAVLMGDQLLGVVSHPVVLGRSADCDLVVNFASISRHHARIELVGDQAIIEDLGSKNGTRVNEREINSPSPLNDGDEIRLGDVALRFTRSDDTTASAAPVRALFRSAGRVHH